MPNGTRSRNLFDPAAQKPFKLSRSKLEDFLRCPRCFYLDRRLGVEPPDGPPFTLNTAVDTLLKREFDHYRARREPHPLMTEHGINAIPFSHLEFETWRSNFKGIEALHRPTNFLVTGALDDLWEDPEGTLFVADYKATSTTTEITLKNPWKQRYKRQMEFYQWLLRRLGFAIADTGYFVFANADAGKDAFQGMLSFALTILPYTGDDGWVEDALEAAHACLMGDAPPPPAAECGWCAYRRAARGCEDSATLAP